MQGAMHEATLDFDGLGGALGAERLEILHAEGRDLVGVWRNVFVVVFRELPPLATLRRVGELRREVAGRFPDGFVALAILPHVSLEAPLLRELREEAARLMTTAPPQLLAVAEVIEGSGFLAATVRSIATGLMLVTRPPFATRIFPGVEPAAAWLAQWADRGERATAARRLVEAMRDTLV